MKYLAILLLVASSSAYAVQGRLVYQYQDGYNGFICGYQTPNGIREVKSGFCMQYYYF